MSTPIFRITHIDNLETLITRGALHAPSEIPADRLTYRTIQDPLVAQSRRQVAVPVGPRGSPSNYVSFYFGPRSPMLLRIATGWNVERVPQQDVVYLVSRVQTVVAAGGRFVFTDGHSLASLSAWYDDASALGQVDVAAAYATDWRDTLQDPDRKRRKQAEFLVHRSVPWEWIHEIGVRNERARVQVEALVNRWTKAYHQNLVVRPDWYYAQHP